MEIFRPPVFFPSPAYFACLPADAEIVIPTGMVFDPKQRWNSSVILSANGPLRITVFLEKKKSGRIPVKDLRISYRENWQRAVWNSVISAYAHAPYFDEWEGELQELVCREEIFYVDYIFSLQQWLLDKWSYFVPLRLSEVTAGEILFPDIRVKPYPQVFRHKFGFVENMNILDLLLNCGPESPLYIEME